MHTWRRWTNCLLLYHLLLVSLFYLHGRVLPSTHWTGSLLAFGLPTVQFSWCFTVGLLLGSRRKYRRWYWTMLLLSFIPLYFVRGICWLVYAFVGLSAALTCLAVCLAVLFLETYAGLLYGIQAHHRFQQR